MQTELHRHLDVSTRLSTLLRLAQERGLESQSTSLEAFRGKMIMKEPLADLSSVLAQFSLFQKVLDRPDVLEQVAFEVVEDIHGEGTRQVELRFSPTFVCEWSKLSWDEALSSFERGVNRATAKYAGMKVGLLCIASRDYGVDAVDRTVEFYLRNKTRFVGVDLAGNEVGFPCRMFEASFKKAREQGAKITVHAGEGTGPQNVWEAIDLLGASRIGHGIHSVEDPKLMKYLAEKKICLEMCPTSNWLTQCVQSFEEHPLPTVLRAGIPVCINTDDPGIFGVTLPHEIEICRTRMGMSEAEIEKCNDFARMASFIA